MERYIIGLDTGGTFTDAAILNADSGMLIAKAKSPTTREDLSIGLSKAIESVISELDTASHQKIERVCLSTTLATNAVVEGTGGRVGLIMIGFSPSALTRNNLATVLKNDPVIFIEGGHKTDAKPQAELDLHALDEFIAEHAGDMSALAVAGHFAVRNPEHEIKVRDYLREQTGLPVTCSHELSNALGGPKRALTALLNARLIDLLEKQIIATTEIIKKLGLIADLMVVKGDGSLLSADFSRLRPVETILSGPAASLSGAAHLVGRKDALVADIGGTTTDIAVLTDGFPKLSSQGATIGGWSTMVHAADIRTSGLGGDSEVRLIDRGIKGGVILGPRRVIPLSVLATNHPQVMSWLDEQLLNPVPSSTDGRFVVPLFQGTPPTWLTRSEHKMAQICADAGICPIAKLAETRLALSAIDRLASYGLIAISAFTPTDASMILGRMTSYDIDAAIKGGELMARQRCGSGMAQAVDANYFANMVLERLTAQTGMALLDSAFAYEGLGEKVASDNSIIEKLITDRSIAIHGRDTADTPTDETSLVSTALTINKPLIALGASAHCYYPDIAKAMGAELIVPTDADVAGAVGAAAGLIRQSCEITITQPADGIFRVHLIDGPLDFKIMETALKHAEDCAGKDAITKAELAGAKNITLSTKRDLNIVRLSADKTLFIEGRISGIATGHLH